MAKALVTGASGFIGPRLVSRLQQQGDEVACLVRPSSRTDRLAPLGVRLVRGDVTDPDSLTTAIADIDQVYHLAGRTHANNLADFLRVNKQGTANLCRACAEHESPPEVLVVSSLAAAGPSPPGKPHTEAAPPKPISQYGRSKLAAELAARQYADSVPITILRPPIVFGPGDHDGLNLFRAIKFTRIHPVPQKKGLPVSLVYSDDLADALALAATQGERLAPYDEANPHDPAGVYYPADAEQTTWAEVGRMTAAAIGVRVWVLRFRKYPFLIPALIGDLMGRLTGKPTLFGMDKLREASASGWQCSSEKAGTQLGFRTPRTLEERYLETAEWYRREGWL